MKLKSQWILVFLIFVVLMLTGKGNVFAAGTIYRVSETSSGSGVDNVNKCLQFSEVNFSLHAIFLNNSSLLIITSFNFSG
ncbi:MAG: hypothetical protein KN64_01465 [Sulfurovum sp. AS07-7]|nr:MAG: hypothetical protein KN64_01465 [Sulfurovum sp. AS07-7]